MTTSVTNQSDICDILSYSEKTAVLIANSTDKGEHTVQYVVVYSQ